VALLAILTLWTLSQKYVEAGAPDASYFRIISITGGRLRSGP
jgi:hypothetical protein